MPSLPERLIVYELLDAEELDIIYVQIGLLLYLASQRRIYRFAKLYAASGNDVFPKPVARSQLRLCKEKKKCLQNRPGCNDVVDSLRLRTKNDMFLKGCYNHNIIIK